MVVGGVAVGGDHGVALVGRTAEDHCVGSGQQPHIDDMQGG